MRSKDNYLSHLSSLKINGVLHRSEDAILLQLMTRKVQNMTVQKGKKRCLRWLN